MNQQNQAQNDDDEAWDRTLCQQPIEDLLGELHRRGVEDGDVAAMAAWLGFVDSENWPHPIQH